MPDEKWQKIREVFDSALRLKPEDRLEFARQACIGDADVFSEVESLLVSLNSSESFLETPAVASVASAIAGNTKRFKPDQFLGHYKIISELGSGGMGEVYLARDQKLDRLVAVKILNEHFSREESSLLRFVREAKAASALNHPNILVIHEIGEADGAHYIVSEYVEGETLRTVCSLETLPLSEILDIAGQIAGALTTAHKAHLIHRDIKPENIMLRPDGYVKILDFGLAKLIEQKKRSVSGLEEQTVRQNQTARGVVMGTVNYMSPEQAKGEETDERTDIFSFGVVLYEMIAGRTPFAAGSTSETFANLINTEPPPLSRFTVNLPDELDRIVSKALCKNKNDRYQSMRGLLSDLKSLRDNLALDERLKKSLRSDYQEIAITLPAASDGFQKLHSHVGFEDDTESPHGTSLTNDHKGPERETKLVGNAPSRFSRPLAFRLIAAFGILAVMSIAGIVGFNLWKAKSQGPAPAITQRRLTVEGGVTRAAISDDGRYSAVAQNAALILFDHENGGQITLVPASKDVRIMTIAFRPDGTGLYFGTRQISTTLITIYSIGLSGGEPKKILDDVYGSLSFSPDSKKFAFMRRYPELNEYALLTADADGSNIMKMASSRMPNRFEGSPTWSPDGRTIACSAVSVDGGFHFTIAKIDAATGSVEFVPGQRWTGINSLSWLADSQRLVLAGLDEKSVNAQIWQLDTKTGAAGRVTDDAFVYESISGTPDGRSIVAVKTRHTSHLWMLGDEQVQITAGFDSRDGVRGLAWAKDGYILYHSQASGHDAIWRMQIDGSRPTEITSDAGGGFAVSPDGRFLVYQGKQSADHLGLQRLNLADRSEIALTRDVTASRPAFFPDGKRVAFILYENKLSLSEISIDGTQRSPIRADFGGVSSPSVSPSGKFIAFAYSKTQTGNVQSGIGIIDNVNRQVVSSHPVKIAIGNLYEETRIQWSNDESEVYFIQLDNTVSNLMKLRIADGTVSKVTDFAEGRIFNFAVEPGGNRILLARGFVERDVSLINIDPVL